MEFKACSIAYFHFQEGETYWEAHLLGKDQILLIVKQGIRLFGRAHRVEAGILTSAKGYTKQFKQVIKTHHYDSSKHEFLNLTEKDLYELGKLLYEDFEEQNNLNVKDSFNYAS